jgi:hypothetical protein
MLSKKETFRKSRPTDTNLSSKNIMKATRSQKNSWKNVGRYHFVASHKRIQILTRLITCGVSMEKQGNEKELLVAIGRCGSHVQHRAHCHFS